MLSTVAALMAVACGGSATNDNDMQNETHHGNDECLICGAPLEYLQQDTMMECVICHKHGPEHHVLVGAALLTVYNNCLPDTAKTDTASGLVEMMELDRQVHGGFCGAMAL